MDHRDRIEMTNMVEQARNEGWQEGVESVRAMHDSDMEARDRAHVAELARAREGYWAADEVLEAHRDYTARNYRDRREEGAMTFGEFCERRFSGEGAS